MEFASEFVGNIVVKEKMSVISHFSYSPQSLQRTIRSVWLIKAQQIRSAVEKFIDSLLLFITNYLPVEISYKVA